MNKLRSVILALASTSLLFGAQARADTAPSYEPVAHVTLGKIEVKLPYTGHAAFEGLDKCMDFITNDAQFTRDTEALKAKAHDEDETSTVTVACEQVTPDAK